MDKSVLPSPGAGLLDIAEAFASRVEELQELVLLRGVDGELYCG